MRLLALTTLGFICLAGAPAARADIIDIAIELVKPELKTAKPVIQCVLLGGEVTGCALKQGQAELEANPYFQDVMEIIRYANEPDYPKLISKVGVTAACTVFDIPGKQLVCDEFAKEVVQVGAAIIEAHAEVAADVAAAAAKLAAEGAALLSCAVGYSCPSNAPDPNYHKVDGYKIRKFNAEQFWVDCYATRVQEGIDARISNPDRFKHMTAVPVVRAAGPNLPADGVLGGECVSTARKAAGISGQDAYQYPYAKAFDPLAAQLNPRWRDMVFAATAQLLEDQAAAFLKNSDNLVKLKATYIAQQTWDVLPPVKAPGKPRPPNPDIVNCIRQVELPASAVASWSQNAAILGDATVLEGIPAGQWAGRIQGFCDRDFKAAIAAKTKLRRDAIAAAVSLGCVRGASSGIYSCPKDPQTIKIGASGIAQCRIAYSGRENENRCIESTPREAAPPSNPPAASRGQPLGPVLRPPPVRVTTPPASDPPAEIQPQTPPKPAAEPAPPPPAVRQLPRLKIPPPQ